MRGGPPESKQRLDRDYIDGDGEACRERNERHCWHYITGSEIDMACCECHLTNYAHPELLAHINAIRAEHGEPNMTYRLRGKSWV